MRVFIRRFGLVALSGAMVLSAAAFPVREPAAAGGNCGRHDLIVAMLGGKYQEGRRAIGLISGRAVLEIYVSPHGTWTVLATNPAGMSCVMAAGEAWEDAPLPVAGPAA